MARGDRQETRVRVLRAADRLFRNRGYTRVTVEDVADRAGYTRGAVYSNFPAGKEGIFLALIEERFDRQLDSAWESLSASVSSQGRMAALGRWMAAEMDRSRDWSTAEVEFAAHASTKPELQTRLAQMQQAGRRQMAELLADECRLAGIVPPLHPDTLALVVMSLARGLMVEWMLDATTDASSAFSQAFAQLFAVTPELPRSLPLPGTPDKS